MDNVTAYSFDLAGNEVSQSLPDPANGTQDSGKLTTSYTYDTVGNVLSLTDPDGNTTTWTYDHLSQETNQSSTVALGYGSDMSINTTTATDTLSYDPDGNLTQSVDADGRVIDYAYNHLNQETNEYWYNTTSLESADTGHTKAQENVSYSYDDDGQMTGASNAIQNGGTGSTTHDTLASYQYALDPVGNVLGQNIALGGLSTNVILSYSYDFNDERTSMAANIGGTFDTTDGTVSGGTADFINHYTYNTLGQMTGVSQTGQSGLSTNFAEQSNDVTAKSATFGYDADSRIASMGLDQSADTTTPVASVAYSYDSASRLADLAYTTGSGDSTTTLAAYQWAYDTDSRVTDFYSYADTLDTADRTSYSSTWATAHYNYDHDNQLSTTTSDDVTTTAVAYSNWASAPSATPSGSDAPGTNSVAFDDNGNRTAANSVSPVSATNRLLFDGTFYYTYDAVGNRTAKFESTSGELDSSATNITIFKWNNANELVSVKTFATYSDFISDSTPSSEVDYTNDPFGRMVSRNDGTTDEYFIYDGQNVALALKANAQVTQRELYGPAVDQILASEDVTAGIAGSVQAAGLVNWLLADNQGTVRDVAKLSDGSTSIVDHLVYDAFGTITHQSNSAIQPFVTYAGMRLDPITGLYNDAARWYDSLNSVFISQDPIGFNDGGTNLAMYCANSSTNSTDPSGRYQTLPAQGQRPGNGAAQIGWNNDPTLGYFYQYPNGERYYPGSTLPPQHPPPQQKAPQ